MKLMLEIAKKVIAENFEKGSCGIFNTKNIMGDYLYTIYNKCGLRIDFCPDYEYFEVFGLTNSEFRELHKFYKELGKQ